MDLFQNLKYELFDNTNIANLAASTDFVFLILPKHISSHFFSQLQEV